MATPARDTGKDPARRRSNVTADKLARRDTQAVTTAWQSVVMNKDPYLPDPVIALDCPACDGTILVGQLELSDEIRCDGCLVAFSLVEPGAPALTLSAIAA